MLKLSSALVLVVYLMSLWFDFGLTYDSMEQLLSEGLGMKKDSHVFEAMSKTDRKNYLSRSDRSEYANQPESIGYMATISAPEVHAIPCETLDTLLDGLEKNSPVRVLDVGSGSGYLVAAFARLLKDKGFVDILVVGIEHIEGLVTFSLDNLRKDGLADWIGSKIEVHVGDGREGWKANAPYHFIHVGAACDGVPPKLYEQLAPGGLMVAPVARGGLFGNVQEMRVLRKDPTSGKPEEVQPRVPVRYVPLTNKAEQLGHRHHKF